MHFAEKTNDIVFACKNAQAEPVLHDSVPCVVPMLLPSALSVSQSVCHSMEQ